MPVLNKKTAAVGIQSLTAPGVRGLKPYQPGKPTSELEREYGLSDIIKLAFNETPLGPAPAALAVMQESLDTLALYPDGGGFDLRNALAAHHGVDAERITLGNHISHRMWSVVQATRSRTITTV